MFLTGALPPELWEEIASYLEQADLLKLVRVCRTVSFIAEPYLYHTIHCTWENQAPKAAIPIKHLLFTLLRRPELALHVRDFRAEELGYHPDPSPLEFDDFRVREAPAKKTQRILDLATSAGLDNPQRWVREVFRRDIETIVALIVLLLRNVRKLTIDMFHGEEDFYWLDDIGFTPLGQVLHAGLCPSPGPGANRFEHLEEFHWPSEAFKHYPEVAGRLAVSDMVPVLRAPMLHTVSFKLDWLSYDEDVLLVGRWLPTSPLPNLTSLSLRYCTIAESFLMQLLAQMNKLEVFRFELFRDCDAPGFDGPLVRAALVPCEKSLRQLDIYRRGYDGQPGNDNVEVESLGSLKSFETLNHLGASIGVLLDPGMSLSDTLPCNIESLHLHEVMKKLDNDSVLLRELKHFLPNARTHTPHLKTLRVVLGRGFQRSGVGADDVCKGLKARCSGALDIEVAWDEVVGSN